MSHKPRTVRLHRFRNRRTTLRHEPLEERRLLAVDTGRIVLEPFSDYTGDGIFQPFDFFEESQESLPGPTLYRDDGDRILDPNLDQPVVGNAFHVFEDLEFGHYFAVAPDIQVAGGPRTVLTTPAVQEFELTSDSPEGYAAFGYWNTGTLSLTVFRDTNANGSRDEGEALVEGKTSINYREGDEDRYSSFDVTDGTNGPGWWRRDGAVQVFSIGTQRDDGLIVTTPDPVSVRYEATIHTSIEFGVVEGATIRAIAYSDITGDGRTEDDRPMALPDVDAKIKITGQTANGQAVDTTLSSLSGYRIEELLPGSYTVELVADSDQVQLFSRESLVRHLDVGAGDSLYVDFAAFFGLSIDKGIDSLQGNFPHENSFAGITVELYRDNGDDVFDPAVDTLLAADTTDSEAHFTLPSFGPGSFFVASRIGEEYAPLEIAFANSFVAESGIEFSTFMSIPTSSVGGSVYVDANRNSRFEPRERGLSGVSLVLEGVDVFGNSVSKQSLSRHDGDFTFNRLLPGTYSITQEQPEGYENGVQIVGTSGGRASANRFDNVLIGVAERNDDYLFGEFGLPGLRETRPDKGDHVGVFEPTTSSSFLRQSNTTGEAWAAFQYGVAGSKAIAGDWDNDGNDGVGVFEPAKGLFRLKNTNRNSADDEDDVVPFIYGGEGFVPLAGDWNSDGVDTVGVYDPATAGFYLRNSNDSGLADAAQFTFGRPGWVPLRGDWDGDGFEGVGVYDPETATFYLRNSLSAGAPDFEPFNYGMPGWKPIAGDWNDDGIVTIGAYNPETATFFLRDSNSAGIADVAPFNYGAAGWEPIVGDWDTYQAALTRPPNHRVGTVVFTYLQVDDVPLLLGSDLADYLRADSAGLNAPGVNDPTDNAAASSVADHSPDPASSVSVQQSPSVFTGAFVIDAAEEETFPFQIEGLNDLLIEQLAVDQLSEGR